MTNRLLRLIVCLAAVLGPVHAPAQERGAAAFGSLVKGLGVTGRVLVIAAHPDDEDTQLITWLARGQQVETAYLSLTRGDGGQNIIGNELGEALGAIRTEELLAARRLDGGRQYFTRAFDFGFSKDADETLTQWSRDSILRDVVTVVRAFRPHVIVSIFSGTPADGHGHHQVAGMLAREAYEVSGDTARFPSRATAGFGPWTVQKFYRSANFRMQERATLFINVGEYDPIRGRSFAEIAAESRSQHMSQAMGSLQPKGVRIDRLMREAARTGPSDASAEQSIFDGIDTTWARFEPAMRTPPQRAALDSLPSAFASAIAGVDLYRPSRSVPALVRIQSLLNRVCGAAGPENPCAALDGDGSTLLVRNDDLHASMEHAASRVERALAAAAGVAVEATTTREIWATGEPAPVTVTVFNRGTIPVRLERRVLLPVGDGAPAMAPAPAVTILPDSAVRDSLHAPIASLPTQPWWLATPRQGAMFGVSGSPQDEGGRRSAPTVVTLFEVGGGRFGVFTPVTYRYADAVRGEVNLPAAAAPAVTLTVDREIEYAPAAAPIERTVRVHLRSHASGTRQVAVSLQLPRGLVADSLTRRVELASGARRTLSFAVRGRLVAGRHQISASARDDSTGETFARGYQSIAYDHIRPRRIYKDAILSLEAVDIQLPRAAKVAYINGVGDNTAPMLEQLGFDVTVIDPATIGSARLSGYTAIVVGTRAYEANPELIANNGRLLEFARNGGTVVVQYGQYEMLQPGVLPYPITLGRPADRVTVEGSPVAIIDSGAAVLTTPNRITLADFEGWVQDRSLYMPRTHDSAWRAVIAMHDPGASPNDGGILIAPVGRGTYVYTTLAFFRQLPNGVPGAARLFANLIAARAVRPVQ